jgi:hypothetical protein
MFSQIKGLTVFNSKIASVNIFFIFESVIAKFVNGTCRSFRFLMKKIFLQYMLDKQLARTNNMIENQTDIDFHLHGISLTAMF